MDLSNAIDDSPVTRSEFHEVVSQLSGLRCDSKYNSEGVTYVENGLLQIQDRQDESQNETALLKRKIERLSEDVRQMYENPPALCDPDTVRLLEGKIRALEEKLREANERIQEHHAACDAWKLDEAARMNTLFSRFTTRYATRVTSRISYVNTDSGALVAQRVSQGESSFTHSNCWRSQSLPLLTRSVASCSTDVATQQWTTSKSLLDNDSASADAKDHSNDPNTTVGTGTSHVKVSLEVWDSNASQSSTPEERPATVPWVHICCLLLLFAMEALLWSDWDLGGEEVHGSL
ncbi:hypothetical protein FRB99_005401 [Tulasnella sp. 403]|nr:hypothetical protein FRB99_005401 [Tulasnella sp. 403]